MEGKQRSMKLKLLMVLAVFVVGGVLTSYAKASAAGYDSVAVQGLVEKARITFDEFMRDPNYMWLHQNVDHARGVLIFPEVAKGGLILGGSGGTGVFLTRDEKTGEWSQPAFYTVGSVTLGLQAGGEVGEVVMVAMTQKAVDSLLSSSFKLGGEASVALGPMGTGTSTNVTTDFVSFAKAKGIYVGLNLEGAVVSVRNTLNRAYYGKAVTPVDILVKRDVTNKGSASLRETLKKAA